MPPKTRVAVARTGDASRNSRGAPSGSRNAEASRSKLVAGVSPDSLRTELFRGVDPTSIMQRTNASGGEKYEGQVIDADGKRQGKGVLWWPNGNVYAGVWDQGAMCGHGTFLYSSEGDSYVGSFADDKKHGVGKYTFANGNSYTGDFAADKRHGKGTYSWMCGDRYEGEWVEGRMHGHGVTLYANGNKYVGDFVEDRREGHGRLSCTDGLAYEGQWLANNRHGEGRLDFPSGDFYQGSWASDKKHGQGRDHFANGNEYVGEYRENAKHGKGRMTYNNGDMYDGTWANDKMEGPGVYTFANGFVYDGEWSADMRHGFGTYRFPNGHVYKGHWASDRRHGEGTLTLSATAPENAGETYKGTWVDGKMNGRFDVLDKSDDLIYRGLWSDGAPSRDGTYFLRESDGNASFAVSGSYGVDPQAKKGMGTVDAMPALLRQLLFTCTAAAGPVKGSQNPAQAQHSTPVQFTLATESSDSGMPTVSAEVLDNLCSAESAIARANQQRRQSALESATRARDDLKGLARELDAADKRLHSSSKAGSLSEVSESADAACDARDRLGKDEADAEGELSVATEKLKNAKEEHQLAAKSRDEAKAQKLAASQKLRAAEQQAKDAAAAASQMRELERLVRDTEGDAASSQERVDELRSGPLAAAEDENNALDEAIRKQKAMLASLEGDLNVLGRGSKDSAGAAKAQLKKAADEAKHLEASCATARKRLSEAQERTAELNAASKQAASDREALRDAARGAMNELMAEQQRVVEEMEAVRGDAADTRAEAEAIRAECNRKHEAAIASEKEAEKHKLQAELYREELEQLDSSHRQVQQELQAVAAKRAAADETASAAGSRQALRQQLDRKLLAAEGDVASANSAVSAKRADCEALRAQLSGLLEVPTEATGGAAGVNRLRKLRAGTNDPSSSPTTPPVAPSPPPGDGDDETVAALQEQLRAVNKKIAKKQEKNTALYREAAEQCAWLPADASESAASVLTNASKEAQLHQVMKLRAQLERVVKDRDSATTELERVRSSGSQDGSDDDAAAEDVEGERLIRDVVNSMKASDRDWRVNYLLEQLENRKQQLLALQEQARYAHELDQRVQAAHVTISGMKKTQPRSAGSRPMNEADHATLRPPLHRTGSL